MWAWVPGASAQEECTGSSPEDDRWVKQAEGQWTRAREEKNPEKKRQGYRAVIETLTEEAGDVPNPRHFLLAGQAYAALGDYAAADTMWQRAVAVWTCYADQVEFLRLRAWQGLFQTGIDAMDQGDTARAIRHLEDAFTIYKQEPDPIFEVGVYYARRAEEAPADSQLILVERATQAFRRALEATERSTRLEPGARRQYRARSALNLATLLSYQEKLDEAAAVYEEFLRVEPDNQEARAKLARVLAMQVERLVSQADTTPDTDQAATLLARAEELRHEAASHYDALLEQPGLQAGDYQEIGIGLWEAGAQDRALAAFRKVIELRPYDPGALEVLAHALYQAERYDTLVTVAESLSVRYPYHRENLAVLAYAYRQLKQPEQALSVLERQQRLPFQILEPSLQSANGAYVAAGALENLTLEPGAPIEVEFQFRRESGEIVATATLATAAPERGVPTPFQVTANTEARLSGFTYRVIRPVEPEPD